MYLLIHSLDKDAYWKESGPAGFRAWKDSSPFSTRLYTIERLRIEAGVDSYPSLLVKYVKSTLRLRVMRVYVMMVLLFSLLALASPLPVRGDPGQFPEGFGDDRLPDVSCNFYLFSNLGSSVNYQLEGEDVEIVDASIYLASEGSIKSVCVRLGFSSESDAEDVSDLTSDDY